MLCVTSLIRNASTLIRSGVITCFNSELQSGVIEPTPDDASSAHRNALVHFGSHHVTFSSMEHNSDSLPSSQSNKFAFYMSPGLRVHYTLALSSNTFETVECVAETVILNPKSAVYAMDLFKMDDEAVVSSGLLPALCGLYGDDNFKGFVVWDANNLMWQCWREHHANLCHLLWRDESDKRTLSTTKYEAVLSHLKGPDPEARRRVSVDTVDAIPFDGF